MNATTEQNVLKFKRYLYEDNGEFGDTKYKLRKPDGVAWTILGHELIADEDTEWTGIYVRSGQILAIMVGDDYVHRFEDKDDFIELTEDVCSCGQLGCGADFRC